MLASEKENTEFVARLLANKADINAAVNGSVKYSNA
jgi:hypothetical protein